ncbi:hypothetical protein CMV_012769 [Castanea mollissima]|uniref:Uncharacterized protein n=1 Tax=Castanea mollissima TaxID=60419 RepID=A0A8J4R0M4_9ROSI|nr:hypothetical protein CMV_012769 [Castanea mollissima]
MSPISSSHVVFAFDATKDRTEEELKLTIKGVQMADGILRGGDTLVLLGILQRIMHPILVKSLLGKSYNGVQPMVEIRGLSVGELANCEVNIEVKITASFPIRKFILRKIAAYKASWVVLDRHLRRDLKFYLKRISSKVSLIHDSLSVEVLRSHATFATYDVERPRLSYSMSKSVLLSNSPDYFSCRSSLSSNYQDSEDIEQSVISYSSYPLSISSQDNSLLHKSNLVPSSSYRSQGHRSSLDFVRNYEQEKSEDSRNYSTAQHTRVAQQLIAWQGMPEYAASRAV